MSLMYITSLQIDPDAYRLNAILYANKAAAAMYLNDYSGALADCNSCILRDPLYLKAYLRRARASKVTWVQSRVDFSTSR